MFCSQKSYPGAFPALAEEIEVALLAASALAYVIAALALARAFPAFFVVVSEKCVVTYFTFYVVEDELASFAIGD